MDAVIPAAGRGTRLGELTADQPKGLVEIAGQPLLAHVFETAVAAGVDHLVVVIGYEGSQIVDRFGDSFEGIPITYVDQREQLGLGDAVLQAEPAITDSFLLLNGDNVFADDVRVAVDAVRDPDVDCVLGVEAVTESVAQTTGVIETTAGAVTGIVEKPDDPPSTMVTTGCYVLPTDIFHACRLIEPSADGEYQLSEAVGVLAQAGYKIETVEFSERVNVNTPNDIERAEKLVRES